jgi:hypothetical protein
MLTQKCWIDAKSALLVQKFSSDILYQINLTAINSTIAE